MTDTVKPSAAGAVARLRGLGLRPVLLAGDNAAAMTLSSVFVVWNSLRRIHGVVPTNLGNG
ncbi:MAG: hypothetical protein ACRDOH_19335 [Streptosporangiaceae bacterium]